MSEKFQEWATKHGPWFVLAMVVLYFYRSDMREANTSLNSMATGIQEIQESQDKLFRFTISRWPDQEAVRAAKE
jgi:hypothetical protein